MHGSNENDQTTVCNCLSFIKKSLMAHALAMCSVNYRLQMFVCLHTNMYVGHVLSHNILHDDS